MDRRAFLATGATVAATGCLGGGAAGDDGTDGGQSLSDHPAARDLASQPTLGPDPQDATAVIVAFEDPSCPTCRRFERQVVPTIRSELTEPGVGAFVFRGYPVVYPWGEPATHALEATYAASPDAHWTLAEHYFDRQNEFQRGGRKEVLDRTERFLADRTDLDAAAVVDAARSGEFDDAVGRDLDAGEAAGARSTPHVFLFRDGEFETSAGGVTSYETIRAALGL